jgi:hypothetical protein
MHKRTQLCGLLSILLGFAFSVPLVLADEESSSLAPNLEAKYRQRLSDMKEQLDNGLSKGWITSTKGDQLKQELSDVDAMETDVSGKGFPKGPTDILEKKVTALNEHITGAMHRK